MKQIVMLFFAALLLVACKNSAGSNETAMQPVGPTFMEDSAYLFCQKQCEFGPRVMNYKAHDFCGEWIAEMFGQYGLEVTKQRTVVKGYDGTPLNCTNIIASYQPEKADRILICAHWDSRPWADNDPDASKHYTPILGANDGASGVGVLLEVARQLQQQPTTIGIDIILLDAEDVGNHRDSGLSDENSWCLGSQYWARSPHMQGYNARFGILLDMVGGANARFQYEYFSEQFARDINRKVWRAAKTIGYDNYFVAQGGGGATDDHLFINKIARIPTIDIIPTSQQYTFFEHWHTVKDDMDVITVPTLKAVGQTLLQVIYNEK
jgi:hypothetical protein